MRMSPFVDLPRMTILAAHGEYQFQRSCIADRLNLAAV